MVMRTSEIVVGLKELCESRGAGLTSREIARWIDDNAGFGPDEELIAFAKEMKARRYARMLTFIDDRTGMRIPRLWSRVDSKTGGKIYVDLLEVPARERKQVIDHHIGMQANRRSMRRYLADCRSGQGFLPFYEPMRYDPAMDEAF
jgi:hypothetical protein